MRPARKVSFQHEWEPPATAENEEPEPILLEVEASISAFYPAVMYLRNGDPGYPAEGGEVEDLEVRLPSGELMNPIPAELEKQLCEIAQEIE